MSHGQNLRDLLAPLGVYRWEGSFQWGELQSEGEALDQVARWGAAPVDLQRGIPAQVEETEDPLEVVVSFPGVEGIPAGFEQTKARIEEILPCHLLVKYQFSDSV